MPVKSFVKRGVPILPKLFAYLVGSIIFLSIVIFGLAAYLESLSGNYYYDSGIPGFLLFVVSFLTDSLASHYLFSKNTVSVYLDVSPLRQYARYTTSCAQALLPSGFLGRTISKCYFLDSKLGLGCIVGCLYSLLR